MHLFLVIYVAGVVISWAPMDDDGKCQIVAEGMTAHATVLEGTPITVKCEQRNDTPVKGEQEV
jgi:hypothetical protein